MNEHNCRICGLYIDELPWGENGDCPTYEICPCCGVEFGNEDYSIESIRNYRRKWISEGANWFDLNERPRVWNMDDQMKNIPEIYK